MGKISAYDKTVLKNLEKKVNMEIKEILDDYHQQKLKNVHASVPDARRSADVIYVN